MSSVYYVYILYREDGVTPFYVGMGKNDRIDQHERYARRGYKDHKSNIIKAIQAMGLSLIKKKVAENITKEAAISLEIQLIKKIERQPHGPLVNICTGGQGTADISPEARAERGAKISAAKTGMKYSDIARENMRAARKALWSGPGNEDRREAARQKRLGTKSTPETKAKIGASQLGKKRSPETCEKLGAVNRGRKRSAESIERIRASQIKRMLEK